MKTRTLLLLAVLCAVPAHAQQVVECRDLGSNGNLAPNETIINGKACRPAGTSLQAIDPNAKPVVPPASTQAATPSAKPVPAAPAPAPGNAPSDGKTRVFVTDSQSWETRGQGSAARY